VIPIRRVKEVAMVKLFIDTIRLDGVVVGRTGREHNAGINLFKRSMQELFGMDVSDDDIITNDHGKPYFIGSSQKRLDDKIFFNISHSGKYIACVISNHEVGCDIQRIRKVPENLQPFIEIIREKVLPNVLSMDAAGKMEQSVTDTLCWTLYESFGKCIGCGVPINSIDLEKICQYAFCIDLSVEGYAVSWCVAKNLSTVGCLQRKVASD